MVSKTSNSKCTLNTATEERTVQRLVKFRKKVIVLVNDAPTKVVILTQSDEFYAPLFPLPLKLKTLVMRCRSVKAVSRVPLYAYK